MKKIALVLSFLAVWQVGLADEGMWLINLITRNMAQMEAMGIKLTAEDIYSVNHSSIKDAIVQLDDGGCTAELISGKGLVLTNHHCAVDAIQLHSSPEHNLLKDGFFAKNYKEELPIPGKIAMILVSIDDVTSKILHGIDERLSSPEYFNALYTKMDSLALVSTQNGKYYAVVKPMYNHNNFYLFLYERF